MKVLAFDQSRFFQHRFEDHLAPVAACLGLSFECLREVAGLARDGLVEIAEAPHFLGEGVASFAFLAVGFVDLLFKFFETFGERTEQLLELRAVLFGEAFGFVLENSRRKIFDFGFERDTGVFEAGGFLFLGGQFAAEVLDLPVEPAPLLIEIAHLAFEFVGAAAGGGGLGRGAPRAQVTEQKAGQSAEEQGRQGPPEVFRHAAILSTERRAIPSLPPRLLLGALSAINAG